MHFVCPVFVLRISSSSRLAYSEGAVGGRVANIGANINGNGNGDAGCVFDRLVAAAKEAQQRKAELGKMRPRGCTFQPQVREEEMEVLLKPLSAACGRI